MAKLNTTNQMIAEFERVLSPRTTVSYAQLSDGRWFAIQWSEGASRATRRSYPSKQNCKEAVQRDCPTIWEIGS